MTKATHAKRARPRAPAFPYTFIPSRAREGVWTCRTERHGTFVIEQLGAVWQASQRDGTRVLVSATSHILAIQLAKL